MARKAKPTSRAKRPPARAAAPKRKHGRPTTLTADVHAEIVKYVRRGAYLKHAAEAAGVSHETVKCWVEKGDKDKTHEPFASFAYDVHQAQAVDAVRSIGRITSAASSGDWKAAAWKLERKYPKLYGANVKLEHEAGPAVQEQLIPMLQKFYGIPAVGDAVTTEPSTEPGDNDT